MRHWVRRQKKIAVIAKRDVRLPPRKWRRTCSNTIRRGVEEGHRKEARISKRTRSSSNNRRRSSTGCRWPGADFEREALNKRDQVLDGSNRRDQDGTSAIKSALFFSTDKNSCTPAAIAEAPDGELGAAASDDDADEKGPLARSRKKASQAVPSGSAACPLLPRRRPPTEQAGLRRAVIVRARQY